METIEIDLLSQYADEYVQNATLRPMQAHECKPLLFTWLYYSPKELDKQEALEWIQNKLNTCEVWIAECEGMPMSYLVTDGNTIIFAYTLKAFKHKGLCKQLITFATGRYLPIIAATLPKKRQIARRFEYDKASKRYVRRD